MAHNLSNEELAEFREIFNLVDRDGGGTITKEELGELMDTLGIDATPEEIDLMIHEIDQDNTISTYVQQIEKLRMFEAHPTISHPCGVTPEWWADADAHRALTRRG